MIYKISRRKWKPNSSYTFPSKIRGRGVPLTGGLISPCRSLINCKRIKNERLAKGAPREPLIKKRHITFVHPLKTCDFYFSAFSR